jgi:molybdenum cofactor cytidylyltransferase
VTEEQEAAKTRIAAIVLAAGGSERMGQPKLLLPVGDQPMVRRVVRTVLTAGLHRVIVVVGSGADAVRRALAGLPIEIVENRDWSMGLSTSLRLGLRTLGPSDEAALVVLADQPGLTSELILALVRSFHASGAAIVAPSTGGRRGNPVLFGSGLFPELLAVEGDAGAREVIARHRSAMHLVEVDDAALLQDVDTMEDYDSLRESYDRAP